MIDVAIVEEFFARHLVGEDKLSIVDFVSADQKLSFGVEGSPRGMSQVSGILQSNGISFDGVGGRWRFGSQEITTVIEDKYVRSVKVVIYLHPV